MPDSFGNLTPQEVQQQILQQQQARLNTAFASNPSGFGKAGVGIGNAIGGLFRKRGVTKDTEAARKSEAQLLADQGFSTQEARQMAEQNVPRGSAQVQQARKVQEAGTIGQKTFDDLVNVIGPERARAAQMTVTAAQLRRFGFPDEATNITLQAVEEKRAEELRLLKLRELKADVRGQELANENAGDDSFTNRVQRTEELRAQIEASSDSEEIVSLERQLGFAEAKIAKDTFISLSDADERQLLSSAGSNKLSEQYIDSKLLDERLAALENTLIEQKGSFASTAFGRFGAGTASFMENTFGVDPGTIGAETLIGDVNEIAGSAAFVSAEIRHALTGAAMSPAEAVFLQPFLATPGKSLSQNLAKVRVIRKFTQLDIRAREALLSNPDTLGKSWLKDAEAGEIRDFKEDQSPQTNLDADVDSALSRAAQLRKMAEERRRARN